LAFIPGVWGDGIFCMFFRDLVWDTYERRGDSFCSITLLREVTGCSGRSYRWAAGFLRGMERSRKGPTGDEFTGPWML
jgi:hypothetical protein